MFLRYILTMLAMPPALNLLVVVGGLLLLWWSRWLGRFLIAVGLLSLALLSTSWAKFELYRPLELYPPVELQQVAKLDPERTALVVLGGGTVGYAEEYQQIALKYNSLQRTLYARHLLTSVSLPVLITGGNVPDSDTSEAELMGQVLEQLGVTPQWLEQQSRTTWENALYSAPILREAGIDTVVLVTDAWHMRRAVESFHAQGLNIMPAPTGFRAGMYEDVRKFLPESYSLDQSRDALHEWLGILVYRLSYDTGAAPAPDAQGVVPAQPQE